MTDHTEKRHSYAVYLFAGSLAGFITDIVYFPLDTIKSRMQASFKNNQALSFKGVSLYQGISSQIIISAPAAALYFVGFEHTKEILKSGTDINHNLVHFLGACVAELCSNLLKNPFEIMKQQM